MIGVKEAVEKYDLHAGRDPNQLSAGLWAGKTRKRELGGEPYCPAQERAPVDLGAATIIDVADLTGGEPWGISRDRSRRS